MKGTTRIALLPALLCAGLLASPRPAAAEGSSRGFRGSSHSSFRGGGWHGSTRGRFFAPRRDFFRVGAFVPFGFQARQFPGWGFGFFAPASLCGFDGFSQQVFVPVRPFGARFVIAGRPFFRAHGRRFGW